VLDDEIIEGAWRTHPEVEAGGLGDSPHYDDPQGIARALAPAADPAPLPGLRAIAVDAELVEMRRRLADALAADGVPRARAGDALLAATELLANAHEHGRGVVGLRAGRIGDRFVCEITDGGPGFDDPFAGYIPPGCDDSGCAGLWVTRQVADQLEFVASPDGHTARLWV
jgi:anti-sigma regulatory factor (Ser/Thr protein kinase)